MSWSLTLEVRSGPDRGLRLAYVLEDEVVFGREGEPAQEGLRPTDRRISRKHLRFLPSAAEVRLLVMEGCKPFVLNGQSASVASLADGDSLQLGTSEFLVHLTRPRPAGDVRVDTIPARPAADSEIEGGPGATVHLRQRPLSDLDLREEIGKGSMGRVLRALDPEGREICVKVLRNDTDDTADLARYLVREADLLAGLDHPNIVRMLHTGGTGEELYLAMEWVDGRTLHEEILTGGPLSLLEACSVGRQLLGALVCSHEAGVVHRDLKPDNVMLRGERGSLLVTLVDFGLARVAGRTGDSALTCTGEARGSFAYSALESLLDAKRVGPPADLFGVAAVLNFALTAKPYYDEDLAGVDFSQVVGGRSIVSPRSRRDDIPPSLSTWIENGLAQAVEARWESAAAMLGALARAEGDVRRALAGLPVQPG